MSKTQFECPVCGYKWSRENAPGADVTSNQTEPIAAFCCEDCERASFVPSDHPES